MSLRQKRDIAVVSPREYDCPCAANIEEFQRFSDRIGERATERGLTEDKLTALLASDD